MPDIAFPLTTQALVVVGILAVGIPLANSLITKPDAPAWLKGILSAFLAAAGAVGAYLTDVKGVPDWNHVWGLIATSLAGVAAFRNAVDPGAESAVTKATRRFGIGPKTSEPRATDDPHGKPDLRLG